MAVFREVTGKLGTKTQAIIRMDGHFLSRVFSAKRDAEAWSKRTEVAIETSSAHKPFIKADHLASKRVATAQVLELVPNVKWKLFKVLEFYGKNITVKKKGYAQEERRIRQWQRRNIAQLSFCDITKDHLQKHVDARVANGLSGSTVRHEIMLLRAIYRDAKKVWKLDIANPCNEVELPRPEHHRERRFEDGHGDASNEEQRLRDALASYNRGDELIDLLDLAIESGLRRSELLYLRVKHIRTSNSLTRVELEDSKSGKPRRVVLSSKAQEIVFRRLKDKDASSRLFSVSESALARFWAQARKDANITGLRWHDLRHEALSRMASKGLHIGELQAQAGHSTPAMTLKYVTVRPQDIANKLG